jgi:hypothetical protein
MTTYVNWQEMFHDNNAKVCPKCRAVALLPTAEPSEKEDRLTPVDDGARFCFECGYQESFLSQS